MPMAQISYRKTPHVDKNDMNMLFSNSSEEADRKTETFLAELLTDYHTLTVTTQHFLTSNMRYVIIIPRKPDA